MLSTVDAAVLVPLVAPAATLGMGCTPGTVPLPALRLSRMVLRTLSTTRLLLPAVILLSALRVVAGPLSVLFTLRTLCFPLPTAERGVSVPAAWVLGASVRMLRTICTLSALRLTVPTATHGVRPVVGVPAAPLSMLGMLCMLGVIPRMAVRGAVLRTVGAAVCLSAAPLGTIGALIVPRLRRPLGPGLIFRAVRISAAPLSTLSVLGTRSVLSTLLCRMCFPLPGVPFGAITAGPAPLCLLVPVPLRLLGLLCLLGLLGPQQAILVTALKVQAELLQLTTVSQTVERAHHNFKNYRGLRAHGLLHLQQSRGSEKPKQCTFEFCVFHSYGNLKYTASFKVRVTKIITSSVHRIFKPNRHFPLDFFHRDQLVTITFIPSS